jgi:hypothetical protein
MTCLMSTQGSSPTTPIETPMDVDGTVSLTNLTSVIHYILVVQYPTCHVPTFHISMVCRLTPNRSQLMIDLPLWLRSQAQQQRSVAWIDVSSVLEEKLLQIKLADTSG